MSKRVYYIFNILLALLLGGFFFTAAQAKEMTIEEALILALEYSPDIQISGEQKIQAEISVDEALASYYPQIDFFAETGQEYNNPTSSNNSDATAGSDTVGSSTATLTISQFIFDGYQTQEEIKRREKLINSAAFQKRRIEETILIDTIRAYTSLLRSQKSLADSTKFLAVMNEIERKLILMVEAGAENEAKLRFVQARMAAALQEKIAIESDLSDARTDLELLIGNQDPDIKAIHPSGNFIIVEDLEKYFEYAQVRNKEILTSKSDREALQHQLESLYGSEYPSLSAMIEVSQSHDVGGDVGKDQNASAMLQLNYNIFDGHAADAGRDRVRSQIREIDLQIENITRDLNQRIKMLYNQVQAIKDEWFVIEEEIAANEEVRRLNQEQFELGEADILELVESEERYFNGKIKLYRAEFDFTQTIHQLKQTAGLLTRKDFLSDYDEIRDLAVVETAAGEDLSIIGQ